MVQQAKVLAKKNPDNLSSSPHVKVWVWRHLSVIPGLLGGGTARKTRQQMWGRLTWSTQWNGNRPCRETLCANGGGTHC